MSAHPAPLLPDPIATSLIIALTLHRASRAGPAVDVLRDLLADSCNRYGITLASEGQHAAALDAFDMALMVRPEYVVALGNRANVLHLMGRVDAALAANDRALAIVPDHIDSHYNRGLILIQLERFDEALACFDRVLATHPDHTGALGNRGVVMHVLGRFQDAIVDFAHVQALQPGDASACMNESLARLAIGDFAGGWKRYEARYGTKMHPIQRDFAQPQWNGETLPPRRRILLHVDQGYGDTIQFCRYARLLAPRARVVMEVPAALRRLLSTLSDDLDLITKGDPLPRFDLHCPFLSLPLAFGTILETIPGDVPYLRAEPALVAAWRARVQALPGLKVGLVWAGDAGLAVPEAAARDRRRSIPLTRLAPLGAVAGVSLISLQKGDAATQASQPPPGLRLQDWTAELSDFADTAALLAALDLVITVDTSVAHLAGSLGAPVWILNRFDACWRWLRDRTDSPWYPSARLFRQPAPGDWDPVIRDVAAALAQLRRTKVQ
jgi:tetratricopeptide (TPR) repeat protein